MKKLRLLILVAFSYLISSHTYGEKCGKDYVVRKSLHKSLIHCSKKNLSCILDRDWSTDKILFIWGRACLKGPGTITFNLDKIRENLLLNTGISGLSRGRESNNRIERAWSGTIQNLTFMLSGDGNNRSGRIIYFHRTNNGKLLNNQFNLGKYAFSATSSGNNNRYLSGSSNSIRKNITIAKNEIKATSGYRGSEGFGIDSFDGANIYENKVSGVGDDPIGIHYSKNIKVKNNILSSVDGRIYLGNVVNAEVAYNTVSRDRSIDGKFKGGIALIMSQLESAKPNRYAPQNQHIHRNTLIYPKGNREEKGAAIAIWGARDMLIEHNTIINEEDHFARVHALLIKPQAVKGWKDPLKLDNNEVAQLRDITIKYNVSMGRYPLGVGMQGNCINYPTPKSIKIHRNIASNFKFYCNVETGNNHFISPPAK